MKWVLLIAGVQLIELTGPNNQRIELNPTEIVSIRPPSRADHFAPGTRCVINTTDGHFVAVQELCSSILNFIEATKEKPQ